MNFLTVKPALAYIYPTEFTKSAYSGMVAQQQPWGDAQNMPPEEAAVTMKHIDKDKNGNWVFKPRGNGLTTPQPIPMPEEDAMAIGTKGEGYTGYNSGKFTAPGTATPQPEVAAPTEPQETGPYELAAETPRPDKAGVEAPLPPSDSGGAPPPATDPIAAPAQSIAELAKQLDSAAMNFGKTYNEQIRRYNPSIQIIKKAVQALAQNPDVQYSPDTTVKIQELIGVLNNAVAEESKDLQIVTQVSSLANEISALVGIGANSPIGGGKGSWNIPGSPTQTRQPTTPTTPTTPQSGGGYLGNLWNAVKGKTSSNLSPHISSASYMFGK